MCRSNPALVPRDILDFRPMENTREDWGRWLSFLRKREGRGGEKFDSCSPNLFVVARMLMLILQSSQHIRLQVYGLEKREWPSQLTTNYGWKKRICNLAQGGQKKPEADKWLNRPSRVSLVFQALRGTQKELLKGREWVRGSARR